MALLENLSHVAWLAPWEPLAGSAADERERLLALSLRPGHPLDRCSTRALAARSDGVMDTLFLLEDPERLCVVHMRQVARAAPDAPTFSTFDSFEDFSEACMLPDHLEHTDEDV
jgi:hypothetical protein